MRTDERSDAPLPSFSGRAAEDRDSGATLSCVLGLVAFGMASASALIAPYLPVGEWASAVCFVALLLSAATGFYAVLFGVGALVNGTRRRARALVGLITGPLPALSFLWVLREATRWT